MAQKLNAMREVYSSEFPDKNNQDVQIELGMLDDSIGYHLRRAQMRIHNSFEKIFEDNNLTPTQFGLLLKIKNNEGISQTALAKANGIERSTLGEIVDRFEKRGWVERHKHKADRRAYALHLTASGLELVSSSVPLVENLENEAFKTWTQGERDILLRLLKRLGDGS